MPITISGSTGIAGVDGSASTPAVQGTDTNTGEFFPAADTIAWTTGGTERMRVNSSGNVGIGTTSPGQKLEVAGVITSKTGTAYLQALSTTNDGTTQLINDGGAGYVEVNGTSAIPMLFRIQGSERMRIDTSGNLLFNSGYGSVAIAYGCRAWVNFNGTGTVAIRASGNVSSITDNGVGQYTINFTNALTDANYSAVGCAGDGTNTIGDRQLSTYPTSSSACKVVSGQTASTNVYDATQVHVAIFR